jgi:thiaminase (transcriptional activator TenA)
MIYAKKIKLFKPTDFKQFFYFLIKDSNHKFEEIEKHLFNKELFLGTLPAKKFKRFLLEDRIYLEEFAKHIYHLSLQAKKSDRALANFLTYLSKDIVSTEKNMQKKYMEQLKYSKKHLPGEAVCEYIGFQKQQVMNESLAVALCSILPCFWVYCSLGSLPESKLYLENNYLKNWIETYSSPSFVRATWTLIAWICHLGHAAPKHIQEHMRLNFLRGFDLELRLFDEVYGLLDSKPNLTKL